MNLDWARRDGPAHRFLSAHHRRILGASAALFIAFIVFSLAERSVRRPMTLAVALVPEEVRAAALRSGYPVEDVWDRVGTIGASALLLRPQNLSVLIDRGDVLHFSRAEAEKWMIAGLVAQSSPLKPNALWVRDRDIFTHISRASLEHGIPVSTQAMGGILILNFPNSIDLPNFPIGFDPQSLRDAMRHRFLPVFQATTADELTPLTQQVSATVDSGTASAFLLDPQASRGAGPGQGSRDGGPSILSLRGIWRSIAPTVPFPESVVQNYGWLKIRHLVAGERAWMALPVGGTRAWSRYFHFDLKGVVLADHVRTREGVPGIRRAVTGTGARLLVVHFSQDAGVEENLKSLREMCARLRDEDFILDLRSAPWKPSPRAFWLWTAARYVLALAFAVLGALLSMRQGLRILRMVHSLQRWPHASPVPEIAAGVGGAVLVSLLAGTSVYALLSFPAWTLGLVQAPWFLCVVLAPVAFSGATLYFEELRNFEAYMRRPVTYRGMCTVAGAAVGLAFLLSPSGVLRAAGLGGAIRLWRALPSGLWWLGFRWREVLVGYPCMTIGLWMHLIQLYRSQNKEGGADLPAGLDPRPWFVMALLAPTGLMQVFGYARMPYADLLGQTIIGAGIGSLLGASALFARHAYAYACSRLSPCAETRSGVATTSGGKP